MDFRRVYDETRQLIEEKLNTCFLLPGADAGLREAMRYSLLAGGKRIRPVLTVKFCEALGGRVEDALEFACGVEMLHTYSLIHDDLPSMDNDDLRRGKPTCHKVYGEAIATLAGDALQAAAFQTVAKGGPCAAEAVAILAEAAGEAGMCGGQYLDIVGEGKPHTAEELTVIHEKKTGALLQAACMLGACAAGEPAGAGMEAARRYAAELGMAFQIQDDLLDMISTADALGKPIGSDAANGKVTFASLLGVEACGKLVAQHTQRAKAALSGTVKESGFLLWLADWLASRNY